MRDEQDAPRTHAHGVEGCQPGLAQAGGQHHQAAPVTNFTAGGQRRQRVVLDRRGLGRRLLLMAAWRDRSRGRLPPLFVGLDPGVRQRHRLRVAEQCLEALPRFQKTRVARIDDPVVPLQPVLQRLPADVAGADERGARHQHLLLQPGEEVGLEVEAALLRGGVHAHLGAPLLQKQQQAQRLGVGDVHR